MSLIASPHRAELRSVKLRGHGDDALLARLRLERALAPVDWHPPGLPEGAVLCVRHMLAHAPAAPGFGERVHHALSGHLRQARRPWHDPAASAADAVWFDRGELAACLIRDQRHGRCDWHWWWRGVLAGRDPAQWLREQVLVAGEQIMLLMDRLAARGEATDWLARLSQGDAQQGWLALSRDYALPSTPTRPLPRVAGRVSSPDDPSALSPVSTASHAASTLSPDACNDRPAASTDAGAMRIRARLLDTVPELRDVRLGEPQRRVLAYALIARRAPAWLRDDELGQAIDDFIAAPDIRTNIDTRRRETGIGPVASQHPQVVPPIVARNRATTSSLVSAAAAMSRLDVQTAQTGDHPETETAPAPVAQAHEPVHLPRSMHSATLTATAPDPGSVSPAALATDADAAARDGDCQRDPSAMDALADGVLAPSYPSDSATTADFADQAPPLDTSIDTDFGGLFYLLNAALALGLYGDFTAPRMQGLALSPWEWLALLGAHWFGREFQRDPLHALLAECAGQTRAAGAGFKPARDWRIEAQWLQPWGEVTRLSYRADTRRLRVWHPQGFVLLDLPRDRAFKPRAQAAALCAIYPMLETATLVRETRAQAGPRARTARWLHRLSQYLQPRLQSALGLDLAPMALRDLICRHRARVRCDLTRIEVHLALADLPLPVRFAGLDRDPGWIPAAGRSIQFHFSTAQSNPTASAGDHA